MLGYNIPVLKTTTTPSNPPSGFLKMYFKTDGKLYTLDSSGLEKDITNVLRGNIDGTLSNQTDLQAALDAKQNSLGFTPENVANKSTSTSLGTSDTQYPTQNAVKTYVDTGLGTKQATLVSGTNIKTINGIPVVGSGDITISGTISDGDKGDITVSSSGTVWTLDNGTVTVAKISASGTPDSTTYLRGDGAWATPPGGTPPVDSVNGQTGVVVLTAGDVGAYADTNPSGFITASSTDRLTNKKINIAAVPSNYDHSGTYMVINGSPINLFEAQYITSGGEFAAADASSSATAPAIGICVGATIGSGPQTVLLHGTVTNNDWSALTVGGLVYLSTTAGAITQTPPSGTGEVVQILGVAVASKTIFVNPNFTLVEIA